MQVNLKVQYSIGDIIAELGEVAYFDSATGLIPVKMGDKLFLGGGCETSFLTDSPASGIEGTGIAHQLTPQNISICVSGPIL